MCFSSRLSSAGWERMPTGHIMFNPKLHWILNTATILHKIVQDRHVKGLSWVPCPSCDRLLTHVKCQCGPCNEGYVIYLLQVVDLCTGLPGSGIHGQGCQVF